MPDARGLLVSIGVGAGIAAFTILFWRWPFAVGIGAGILMGGLALTGTISIGHDGAAADAAWRAAAPDLQDPPAEPSGDVTVQPTRSPPDDDRLSGD